MFRKSRNIASGSMPLPHLAHRLTTKEIRMVLSAAELRKTAAPTGTAPLPSTRSPAQSRRPTPRPSPAAAPNRTMDPGGAPPDTNMADSTGEEPGMEGMAGAGAGEGPP